MNGDPSLVEPAPSLAEHPLPLKFGQSDVCCGVIKILVAKSLLPIDEVFLEDDGELGRHLVFLEDSSVFKELHKLHGAVRRGMGVGVTWNVK